MLYVVTTIVIIITQNYSKIVNVVYLCVYITCVYILS